jgi:hypothetical protein
MGQFPGVSVNVTNGNLGLVAGTEDGVAGLIGSGVAIVGGIQLNTPTQIFSVKDAEDLGFGEGVGENPEMYAQIVDFYNAAGQGAELWVSVISDVTTMADICDINNEMAKKMLDAAEGRIRLLVVTRTPDGDYVPTFDDGLDDDVTAAMVKAQALAEAYAAQFKPVRIILDGRDYQGVIGDLLDLKQSTNNRVAIVIGAGAAGAASAAALLAGRLAQVPVQRNPGRVKDGDVGLLAAYFTDGSTVESLSEAEWSAIHNKGYIFLRKFNGKNGYFWSDDPTATGDDDDYSSLARGRVIDKAIVIAARTYTEELLDDIEVDSSTGQMQAGVIKSYQAAMKKAIEANMLVSGEISGVDVVIDPKQDVLSTEQVAVSLEIIPKAYSKSIKVDLGFSNPSN